MVTGYYELAGAIIRQAIHDYRRVRSGHVIPGVTSHNILMFFYSDNFEMLAGPYADVIRSEVFRNEQTQSKENTPV